MNFCQTLKVFICIGSLLVANAWERDVKDKIRQFEVKDLEDVKDLLRQFQVKNIGKKWERKESKNIEKKWERKLDADDADNDEREEREEETQSTSKDSERQFEVKHLENNGKLFLLYFN